MTLNFDDYKDFLDRPDIRKDTLVSLCLYLPHGTWLEVKGHGKEKLKSISIEDDGRIIINNQYNLEDCMVYLKDFYDMDKLDLLAYHQKCIKYGSMWIPTEESIKWLAENHYANLQIWAPILVTKENNPYD